MIETEEKIQQLECKYCGGAWNIERVSKTKLQRIISLVIPIKRYYCRKCMKNFILVGGQE